MIKKFKNLVPLLRGGVMGAVLAGGCSSRVETHPLPLSRGVPCYTNQQMN